MERQVEEREATEQAQTELMQVMAASEPVELDVDEELDPTTEDRAAPGIEQRAQEAEWEDVEELEPAAESRRLPKLRIKDGRYMYLTPNGWRARVPQREPTTNAVGRQAGASRSAMKKRLPQETVRAAVDAAIEKQRTLLGTRLSERQGTRIARQVRSAFYGQAIRVLSERREKAKQQKLAEEQAQYRAEKQTLRVARKAAQQAEAEKKAQKEAARRARKLARQAEAAPATGEEA